MKKAPILLLSLFIIYTLTGCKEYTRNQIIGDYKCNTRYTSSFNGPDSTGHWNSSSSDTTIYSVYNTVHIEKGGASDRIRIDNVEFYPTDSRLTKFYVVGETLLEGQYDPLPSINRTIKFNTCIIFIIPNSTQRQEPISETKFSKNSYMKNLNAIGLDSAKSKKLAEKLNVLLANYSLFYQNTRGYHWNIKGEKFFELHLKFEELYNDLVLKIDEVAERILTLGHSPNHNYSDYKKIAKITEAGKVTDGKKAVEDILHSFKIVIALQRELLTLSGDAGDEGTNALMSDYIRAQEKSVWMYSAFLQK
jgi:starvation-inducible DNA-binding protein